MSVFEWPAPPRIIPQKSYLNVPKTNHLSPEAAQAALDALLVKARSLDELRAHALDIREPEKVIRELDKRIRRTERLIGKAARKLRPSS